MKKHRSLPWVLALLFCLCLVLSVPGVALADFGSFSGDMDFGDFDLGGAIDDFDSFEDSYSSSPGVYVDGDSSSEGDDNFWIYALIFGGVFVLLLILGRKGKKKGGNRPAGASRVDRSKLTPIANYCQLDPAFDQAALQEKLSNLYVQMQNGWTDKDLEPLRPYFTDALFTQMERQVGIMKSQGVTNYVDRIAVLGVSLLGYYQANGEDHLVAELRTRIVDYTLKDADGKLVSGSQSAEKFMVYEWDLARVSGVQTQEDGAMQSVTCPGCGAPLSINTSAKCPYCDRLITLEQHDWAITAIRGIAQQTK